MALCSEWAGSWSCLEADVKGVSDGFISLKEVSDWNISETFQTFSLVSELLPKGLILPI